ncbi:hypothetical protein RFI_30986, partial [Reticulomyxa filosa]
MIQIITTNCPKIAQASPLQQTAFYKYLFNQFAPLVDNFFLRNKDKESQEWPLRFKHEITKSIIEMGIDLSSQLYERRNMYNRNESEGEDEFYLCKKWQVSQDFLYLVNQDNQNNLGTISILTNNAKSVSQENIWKISTKIAEKDKKTESLLRIVGTKETSWAKIKVELWGMEFMPKELEKEQTMIENIKIGEFRDYVLTYDNMLKMIAIYLRIQSNIPIILMGETGCGKTLLIKFLAKVAN